MEITKGWLSYKGGRRECAQNIARERTLSWAPADQKIVVSYYIKRGSGTTHVDSLCENKLEEARPEQLEEIFEEKFY